MQSELDLQDSAKAAGPPAGPHVSPTGHGGHWSMHWPALHVNHPGQSPADWHGMLHCPEVPPGSTMHTLGASHGGPDPAQLVGPTIAPLSSFDAPPSSPDALSPPAPPPDPAPPDPAPLCPESPPEGLAAPDPPEPAPVVEDPCVRPPHPKSVNANISPEAAQPPTRRMSPA